jgi:hypothetical protein
MFTSRPTAVRSRPRALRVATCVVLSTLIVPVAGPSAHAAKKSSAKKSTTKKPSVKNATTATPTAPFDPNVCTYLPTDAVSRVVGVTVRLDTRPGNAGSNTHWSTGNAEQCVFVVDGPETGQDPAVVVQIDRKGAGRYAADRAGEESTGTLCPAACLDLPEIGDAAFLTSAYGVGGGFVGHAAIVVSRRGAGYLVVTTTPTVPGPNRGPAASAREIQPSLIDSATALTREILNRIPA